jgi:hypothetical protein
MDIGFGCSDGVPLLSEREAVTRLLLELAD